MFALRYDSYGGSDVTHLEETAEPHAGPGQIRIKVEAASINAIDWKIREGSMTGGQPLDAPSGIGMDGAGVVDEVGEGVTDVEVGDDVFGIGADVQAEYAVLDYWSIKPSSVDWAVAGGAGVVVETAERCLRMLGVKKGDTVFIDGGSGGVGSVAIQLAVAAEATVIASASQDNHDYLRELGASPVLYGDGLVGRVRAMPDSSIDAVFDVVGKTPIEDLIALAPEPSQVVSIANFEAPKAGARATGGGADSHQQQALALGAQLLADGRLVIQTQTFPFDRFDEAYQVNQTGHGRGKTVLVP